MAPVPNPGHPTDPALDSQKGRVVVHTPEPSEGAGLYVYHLVDALAELDRPIVLFCPENFERADALRTTRAALVFMPARQISSAGLAARIWRNARFLVKTSWRQMKLIRRGDIVHFQFPLHFPGGLVLFGLAALKRGIIVYTAHDPLPHRWLLPARLRGLDHAMLRLAYNMSRRIIVHNAAGRKVLMEQFGQGPEKIDEIPHGTYVVGSAPPPPPSGALRLLLFGGVRENKGVHLAIEAVQRINSGRPGAVLLTIAGTAESAREQFYWDRCFALIGKAPDGIETIGRYIEDEEVGPLLARHHAVLLPYLNYWSESGVAALALSNRRALIATQAGGLNALLAESGGGMIIEAGTVEGVAEAIERAIATGPDGLLAMGSAGAEYILANRSWPAIAALTTQTYDAANDAAMEPRLILHTPEPISSSARYVEELTRALTVIGYSIRVICPANHQFREDMERNPRMRVILTVERSIDSGRSFLGKMRTNFRFLASSAGALLRHARRNDVVHLQYVLHFPFGALFFLCALARRAKIVFTVHDPIPHKWLLPARLRWLETGALAWSYGVSDCLIVHSEPGRAALITHFKQDSRKISVIVHGPYELGAEILPAYVSDSLEVLVFGALRENKGIHLAIEAVQKLRREGLPLRLTIAGSVLNGKEAAYWAGCRERINADPDGIRLIEEFIPDSKLLALFADCHCVLLPYTRFFSDSGVASMVLAAGRPIVATRLGGLGPLLRAAEIGIAIESGTVEGVSDALRFALELGPAELLRRGKVGADYVRNECGWPRVAAETGVVYSRTGIKKIPRRGSQQAT